MSKLVFECQSFLRFMNKAKEKLIEWHGPHCNYDPLTITLMAAREWDSMLRIEQKHFLLSASRPGGSVMKGVFCNYSAATHRKMRTITQQDLTDSETSPRPSIGASIVKCWNKLEKSEQEQYAQQYLPDYFMTKVIEQRDHLHQLYDPRTLAFLEFIIKTRPLKPSSAYFWFLKLHSRRGDDRTASTWHLMNDLDRSVYYHCAVFDKKRYKFERESFKAILMTLDQNEDNFELKDFMLSPSECPSIERLGRMMIHSGGALKPPIREKRPRMPFSLFIEDHRYAIRDKHPRFQFGEHLRLCSEAWAKLTEEEKKVYSDRSRKLTMDWKARCAEDEQTVSDVIGPNMFSLKARTDGKPTRPNHLWSRVPVFESFIRKCINNRSKSSRKSVDQITDTEREAFFQVFEARKKSVIEDQSKKLIRLAEVKALLKEARKLASIKRQLLLKCQSHKHEKIIDTLVDQLSQSDKIEEPFDVKIEQPFDEIASISTGVKSQ